MFGVVFPDRSYPIDATSFTPVGPLDWILDMNAFPGKSASFSSTNNNISLPPDKALAVHIQSHDSSPFIFCGAIHAARPSAVLTLPWPDPADQSPGVPLMITRPEGAQARTKIGVSVEDLATLPQVVDAASQGKMERLAMRVGENLFNLTQSFCGVDGDRLVVPMDILDRWFVKFQEKARKDPEFLKGFSLYQRFKPT